MLKYFYKKYFCRNNKFLNLKVDKSEYINVRFDRFLSNKFNLHWNTLQKHFRKNEIFLIRGKNENRMKIKDQNEKLKFEDEIFINKKIIEIPNSIDNLEKKISLNSQSPSKKKFFIDEDEKENLLKILNKMIVFKSDQLIVIDKASNLACQGGTFLKFSIDTMLSLQNELNPEANNLKLIHRLDKNVSGLMMIANNIETARILGEYIKNNKIEKSYLALTQNIPLYLKYLIKENKVNVNVTKTFKNFFSGFIKSNESCQKFLIELESGYQFLFDGNFEIVKPKTKINFNQNEDMNMSGRFKITDLIFYDNTNNKFKTFQLEAVENFNYDLLNELNNFLSKVVENFDKKDSYSNVECYSLIKYELISGKKHQIRKHFTKCFFTPIFNDEEYMFDKESSNELYKRFIQIENESSEKKNPLHEKYNIDHLDKSILLQSIRICIPKINLTNLSFSNKIETFEENEKYVIRFNDMPRKFVKLFDIAKLKVSYS